MVQQDLFLGVHAFLFNKERLILTEIELVIVYHIINLTNNLFCDNILRYLIRLKHFYEVIMSEKLEIILGKDEDYEKTIYIEKPKGRRSREMMPKILKFMSSLKDVKSDDSDLSGMLLLINALWSKQEFEDELVPYVLGMEDNDGRKYLDENCTIFDIIEAFTKAAKFMLEKSFDKKEVQEALGKSNDEAQEEAPVSRKRKIT